MNELIVMTGAAGGIGSHLVRELSDVIIESSQLIMT